MKMLVCWMLLSLALLGHTAEELLWTTVNIPGLEISGSGENNLGLWFHEDFGWLNAGKQLWITHDAGRNWTLSLTPPEKRLFYDSYFTNALEGWTVVVGLYPNSLFHTQDGGRLWRPMKIELTQTSDNPVNPGSLFLTRIYFKDSLHGIGTFTIDKFPIRTDSIVARTEDGGHHWTEIARSSPFPQLFGFGEHVWIGSRYSPDFGETFRLISKPRVEFDLFFVSPLYGWAIDYSYVGESYPRSVRYDVLKTIDGGHTWSVPIFSRIGGGIWDICLISEEIGGFIWYPSEAGDPPLFYMTYDGGGAWFSYNVPFRHGQGVPRYSYEVSCNRERKEVWLVPSFVAEETTLFYASIETVTAVQPSSKLFSTWGAVKKIRKED